MAKLALIENGGFDTWMIKDPRPRLDGVESAADWLFVNEVQLVGKLFCSHLSSELC